MSEHTLNRREVLTATAGLVAATGITSEAKAQTGPVPGIQLYTVRDSMATETERTLRAIAGMGYKEVEYAGYFGFRPQETIAMLDRYGLVAPSTHVNGETVEEDPNPFCDIAAEIGHDYVTIAYMREENRQTADDWKRWAEVANRLGEACRERDMRAAYHNHDFELKEVDGIIPFDVLLDETDADLLEFEVDMYWVVRAGVEVQDLLARAPERMTMSHMKDMDVAGNFANVGEGTIDFAAILAHPAAAHMKHHFVEHDQPEDPFRSAAASHFAMKELLQ